jgi:hypothetical protein
MKVNGGGGNGVLALDVAMTSSGRPHPRLRWQAIAMAAMAVFVDGSGMEPMTTTTVQRLLMPLLPSAAMVVIVVDYAVAVDAAATILSL